MGKLGVAHKKTPKATRRPTMLDIAWAAGFIEGEGTLDSRARPVGTLGTRLSVGQVNREPLQRLQEIFGGSIREQAQGRYRPIHIWSVSGARARGAVLTIWRFLSEKRRQQFGAVFAHERALLAARAL